MGSSFENSREILTNHSKWQETPFLHGEKKKKKSNKKKWEGRRLKAMSLWTRETVGHFFI